MINPIDNQLAVWKVEQNAQDHKDPSSPVRQAIQGETAQAEAEHRDNSVQNGEESQRSQKNGVGDRDGRRKKQDKKENNRSLKKKNELDGGLDLYA